jgi:hypothetical protein
VLYLAYFWDQLAGLFFFFYREKKPRQMLVDPVSLQREDMS